MDWRRKSETVTIAVAIRISEDENVYYRVIDIGTGRDKPITEINVELEAGEEATITQWHRPSWTERRSIEKSLERPVEVNGNTRLVYSPSDLSLAYVGILLEDWTFTNNENTKLAKAEVMDIHPQILEAHLQLFLLDLKRL